MHAEPTSLIDNLRTTQGRLHVGAAQLVSSPVPATVKGNEGHNDERGRARILKLFAALFAVSLLLRIFYSGHLCQDDGLWFTAGEEVLRGKALYREIYFDKPPALPLVYALAFWAFGAHIIVIRILTSVYVVAVSAVLYRFNVRLYDRRSGMFAAALFTFFSTISINNHEQGLNTDMLMTLPYAAAAYYFVRACFEKRRLPALVGGILTGLAVQANPKGLFALGYFVLLLLTLSRWRAAGRNAAEYGRDASLFLCSLAGVAVGSLPVLVYLAATHSLADYWLFVWDWGFRYSSYLPAGSSVSRGAWATLAFIARNNTLLFGFVFVIAFAFRSVFLKSTGAARLAVQRSEPARDEPEAVLRSDIALLIWFLVSYGAIAMGGRFYSNYFILILPSLCLIGSRGLLGLLSTLKTSSRTLRRATIFLIAAGFAVTLIRFHARTAMLAADWLRGTKSSANAIWYHERLNREERVVAANIREVSDTPDKAGPLSAEAIRAGSPRSREANGGSDYLFVWASRAEIYYWSGLLPASRYLSTQPLTGVAADVHHDSNSRPIVAESLTAAARIELAADLEMNQPRYIVDEIGFLNDELSIQSYPELRRVLVNYDRLGATGPFLIYRRKE